MVEPYTFPDECWAIVQLAKLCPTCHRIVSYPGSGTEYEEPVLMKVELDGWWCRRDEAARARISYNAPDDACCQDVEEREAANIWPSREAAVAELTKLLSPDQLASRLRD